MAKLTIKKASTDVTVYCFIQASNVTTGAGLTGLTFETASLVASYVRPLAARAAITLATLAAADSAHSDGGFKEIDATNMPGVYRLDLPDAVCATGVPSVVVMLKGAENMSPLLLEIQLTDFDLNSTSNAVGAAASVTAGVSLADDAITSAKFDESTAFPVKSADTGATQIARVGADSDTLETLSDEIAAVKAETALIVADTGTDGVVVASLATDSITAAALKADAVAEIAGAVWDVGAAGHSNSITFGGKNQNKVPSETINDYKADVSGLATPTNITAGTITTVTNLTNLPAITTDWLTAAGVKADAVTKIQTGLASSSDLSTIDDFLDTEVAAILADTNELQTDLTNGGRLDLLIDAIKAKTDNLPADPADDSDIDAQLAAIKAETALIVEDTGTTIPATLADLALEATLTAIKGAGWTDETLVALMTAIEAISAGSGATAQEVWEYTTRILTAGTNIDISSLATAANLAALDGKVDTVDGIVDAILEDTGTTIPGTIETIDNFLDTEVAAILEDTATTIPATLATIEGKIDTVDTVVDAIKAKTDNLPADPADDSDIDTAIAAVKTVVDAILVDTGTTLDGNITAILADTNELQTDLADGGRLDLLIDTAATGSSLTAADLWAYTPRTLTNAGVSVNVPATGDPIYLYRDTTNVVSFTDLGVVSTYTEADDKAWFSIKDNLNDADASAIVHVSTTSPGDSGAASSLLYINGSAPVAATDGSFLFTDYTAGNATLTLKPAASDDLPVYSVTPLYWDIKVYDKSTDTITILQQGTAYILATATRTTS